MEEEKTIKWQKAISVLSLISLKNNKKMYTATNSVNKWFSIIVMESVWISPNDRWKKKEEKEIRGSHR